MTKYDVKALREKALNSDDIKYDEIFVPAWDVTLPIKTLSSAEMKKVMKSQDDHVRMMILAVLMGCKTREGEAVFEEKDLAKMEQEKSFAPIAVIAEKILGLSGYDEEADKEAKNN